VAIANRVPTRTLLLGGIVGPVLFVAVILVAGAIRQGYDPVRQYVSLLSLGDGGWVQSANFVLAGLLIAAFGVGLRRTASEDRAGRWMARFVTAAGLGLIWNGIFATDPAQGYPAGAPPGLPTSQGWHATLHYLGSVVVFGGLAAASALSAWRGIGTGRLSSIGWAAYSLLGGAIVLGGWIGPFLIVGPYGIAPTAGLLQRLTIVAGMQWLVVVALLQLRRLPGAAATEPTAA